MQTLHPDIERLSAFLEGELSPAEAQGLQAHLDACPACREDLAQFQAMLADIKNLPTLTAPPDFVGKVMERIEREPVPVLALGVVWWKKLMGWKFLAPVAVAMLALFMIRQPEQKDLEIPSVQQFEKSIGNSLQAPPGLESEGIAPQRGADLAAPQAAAPDALPAQDSKLLTRGEVASSATDGSGEAQTASANGFAPAPEASMGGLREVPSDRTTELAGVKAPRSLEESRTSKSKDTQLDSDEGYGSIGTLGKSGTGLGGGGAGQGYGAGYGTLGTSGRGSSGPANAGASPGQAAAPKGAAERESLEKSTIADDSSADKPAEPLAAGVKNELSRDEKGRQAARARENRSTPSVADEVDAAPAAVGRITGDKVAGNMAEKKSASTPLLSESAISTRTESVRAEPVRAEPVRAEPMKEQQAKSESSAGPRSGAAPSARPSPAKTPDTGYAPAPPATTTAARSPKEDSAQPAPAKPRSLAQDMDAQGEAAKAGASGEAATEEIYQSDGEVESTELMLSRRKAKTSPIVLTDPQRPPDAVIVVVESRNVVRELRRLVVEQKGVAGTAQALPNGRQRIVIQLPPNAYGPLLKAIQKSMTLGATPPPASPELQRIWIEILP